MKKLWKNDRVMASVYVAILVFIAAVLLSVRVG